MGEGTAADVRASRLDALTHDLRRRRESAGVSYRELAARITRQRESDGRTPASARIAHTTVSDAFRLGRSRINPTLVAEIIRALGDDPDEADRWRERAAQLASEPSLPPAADPAPDPVRREGMRPSRLAVLIVGGVLLNATGKFLNPLAGDVLFLDMVGTAAVALLVGPWSAAGVGVLFGLTQLLKGDVAGALFATTMVTSGLVWGYGVRLGWGRSLWRFLALSLIVAVTTSALAVPISVLYFDGEVGRGLEPLIRTVTATGADLWSAVSGVNLSVSIVDKVLTGALAFGVARLYRDSAARRPGIV